MPSRRPPRSGIATPDLDQRTARTVDRIGVGQRDGRDVGENLLAFGRVGAAQVPAHPVRVGADDEQVTARARVLEAVRLGPSHGRQFYPLDSSIVPLA